MPWSSADRRTSAYRVPPCQPVERLGGALEEVIGGGRARVLVIRAALTQVAGSSLARDERDRRLHALLGGLRRRAQAAVEVATPLERLDAPAPARRPSSCRPAAPCPAPGRPRSLAPGRGVRRQVDLGVAGQRRCPSAGTASRTAGRRRRRRSRSSAIATVFSTAPASACSGRRDFSSAFVHAAVHVGPVVAVADRGVERDQLLAVLSHLRRRTGSSSRACRRV